MVEKGYKEVSDLLLPRLKAIQEKEGYISEKSMKELSKELKIPISRIYGVATFYAMLHTKKQGKHIIEICNSPSCHVNGSNKLISYIEKELGVRLGNTTPDGNFSFYATSCIGCCDEAPAMLIDGKAYTNLDEKKVKEILEKCRS